MYLCGTEGAIRADVLSGRIEHCRIGSSTPERFDTGAMGGHGGGDEFLGQSLAATMLEGAPSETSLWDGLTSAVTAFAMNEAMADRSVVEVTPYLLEIRRQVQGPTPA